ncbi:DUF7529 family protein [Halobacterium wangiae]|uniref:DUF7529 family protein n=1 Tax=Halobacterium wangiae TaxID=2902623 RepID=UPI001E6365C9|nr:hypothetical protein [Halobacterium wangiae]
MQHPSSWPSNEGESTICDGAPKGALRELCDTVAALERGMQQDGWKTVATTPHNEVIIRDNATQIWIVHKISLNQETAVAQAVKTEGVVSDCRYIDVCAGWLFELILLLNPGVDQGILLPTIVNNAQVDAITSRPTDSQHIYSLLTCPGGRHLGVVKHNNPESFLPDPVPDSNKDC